MTRTRDQRLGAAFRPSPKHERLSALRRDDPAAFARLPAAERMALAYYQDAKAAHDREHDQKETTRG